MSKILLTLLLLFSCIPLHDGIVEKPKPNIAFIKEISKTYKVSLQDANTAVYYSQLYSKNTFPNQMDILSIMAVESGFKVNAKNGKARGLMQVLYVKTTTPDENVRAGVFLLEEHMRIFKDKKAAIIAYNVGMGNYRNKVRNYSYYKKFLREKSKLENLAKL